MMGHKMDKYDYDKAATDIDWMKSEYLEAAPFLNIMSSDRAFGKVDIDEVEALQTRVAELEEMITEMRPYYLRDRARWDEREAWKRVEAGEDLEKVREELRALRESRRREAG